MPGNVIRMILPHVLLLATAMFEVFELELASSGPFHHVLDGIVVFLFAFSTSKITQSRPVFALIAILGGIPWALDIADVSFEIINVESLFWMAMHGTVVYCLVHRIFRVTHVTRRELLDAISIYMVAGIAFANVYSLILWSQPNAIVHSGAVDGASISYSMVLYFSFVTQLTVGYGDVAPATGLTRSLALIQSMFGVLYLAILIARFVSLHTLNAASSNGSPPE